MAPFIESASPGSVQVVAAMPGMGKTTAMYAALAEHVAAIWGSPGTLSCPYRILWATQSTIGEASLGEGACKDINEAWKAHGLPTTCRVLKGRDHCSSKAKYDHQFSWEPDESIRVISHAHLPVLLADSRSKLKSDFMAEVKLIVVDEDPLNSLVTTIGLDSGRTSTTDETIPSLTPAELQWHLSSGKGGALEKALFELMEELCAGEHEGITVENPISGAEQISFSGAKFWEALRKKCSAPDWKGFEETLTELCFTDERSVLAGQVVQAFKEDFSASGCQQSGRFGLQRLQQGGRDSVGFRADVLRVLPKSAPPIIVLDAYAEEDNRQYKLMFPEHDVKIKRLGEIIPLDIEIEKDLYIERNNLNQARSWGRRRYALEYIEKLCAAHLPGVLVLSFKNVLDTQDSKLREDGWACPKNLLTQHWFAGRGSNRAKGCHVLALHPPERPTLFANHFLAALSPNNATLREQLARHLRDTELLQMFHRGRQPLYGGTDKPRVIAAFDCSYLAKPWANVTVLPEILTPKSKNPVHRYALRTLAEEIANLYGAIPHDLLVTLGLFSKSKATPVRNELKEKVYEQAGKNKSNRAKAPHFANWTDLDSNPIGYTYEPAANTNPQAVLRLLTPDARFAELQSFKVEVPGYPTKTRVVYATSKDKAQSPAVLNLLKVE
ncbi:hypothetical protein [Deinococcus radiophilus]|uniref:hypothetical protein n=1 Tax=Deinococcus radiophilus TaxID=32062 RepID=UPI001E35962D|nr:hypothetical protein [Deinococcus radiophilus]UFA50344.1 hypothetical protein LMT64_10845 [Deinococcus radiophilus]